MNLGNLDVFEIMITQKLLKCPKDPFVRSAPKIVCAYSRKHVTMHFIQVLNLHFKASIIFLQI